MRRGSIDLMPRTRRCKLKLIYSVALCSGLGPIIKQQNVVCVRAVLTLGWSFPTLKYKYIFSKKIYGSNSIKHHSDTVLAWNYHRRKKRFYVFFYILVTFFTFFYFPNFFYFFKNVGKVQSGKQINKKHFQNNSNEIDLGLWFFCYMSNIEEFTASLKRRQFLQNQNEWHIPSCLEGHFLSIRRGVELH